MSQDIICFEEGSGQAPWLGSANMLRDDMDHLKSLAQDGIIALAQTGSTVSVAGLDRVGLVILPSGRRIVIRSKIDNLVLLDWLVYLHEFPPLEMWLPEAGVAAGNDFHSCIARLFLYELEKVTRLHLRKDYMPTTSASSTIRGRILVTRFARGLHRLPLVPQRHRLRTLDTKYNIVLAVALDRLPCLLATAPQSDRRLLAGVRDEWAHISRDITDPFTAVTESQWGSPPGYVAALQLARLILMGASLDPQSRFGGQAFTLSLSLIWERALRRLVDELEVVTAWRSVPDASRTRKWDDPVGQSDPSRWLTADVIGERDDNRWVLDAKYKRAFGNESRNDRFQMCAYAVAFDAGRVSLVYPTAQAVAPISMRLLLRATVGGKSLLIDSIELPMNAGPSACKIALEECMKPRAASPLSGSRHGPAPLRCAQRLGG
jgi:5-methylcytosine-specific restriction endonuclease McrBC regulatory subunit McrC